MMYNVPVNIPDPVVFDKNLDEKDPAAFVRRATALFCYTRAGVSLGYCAQIAEMSKPEFIKFLSENGISIFELDEDELERDINNA